MAFTKPIKDAIAQRDGMTCHYCGLPLVPSQNSDSLSPDIPQLEHKIPQSRGGTWALDNLVLSCRSCNSKKKQMTDEEFKAKLEGIWRYYEWCNEKQRRTIPAHWFNTRSR